MPSSHNLDKEKSYRHIATTLRCYLPQPVVQEFKCTIIPSKHALRATQSITGGFGFITGTYGYITEACGFITEAFGYKLLERTGHFYSHGRKYMSLLSIIRSLNLPKNKKRMPER